MPSARKDKYTMSVDLNSMLESWLEQGGRPLQKKIEKEISDRHLYYPTLRHILSQRPIDIPRFTANALECWVLDRYKKMRLNAFAHDVVYAEALLTHLLDELPVHPEDIAHHVDDFIDRAVAAGFMDTEGHRDLAGAATLASLVLSAYYPDSFVDYPSLKRWRNFVQRVGFSFPSLETHGQYIVWASEFAQELAEQPIFQLKWPELEPMWVASALCWASGSEIKENEQTPATTLGKTIPVNYMALSLAELRRRAMQKTSPRVTRQERRANIYARSYAIKAYALKRAQGVCEGCGETAPFKKPSGEPFLEVHHIDRLADGGPDAPDAVVALCPNCHRRAHYAVDAEKFNEELRTRVQCIESEI